MGKGFYVWSWFGKSVPYLRLILRQERQGAKNAKKMTLFLFLPWRSWRPWRK